MGACDILGAFLAVVCVLIIIGSFIVLGVYIGYNSKECYGSYPSNHTKNSSSVYLDIYNKELKGFYPTFYKKFF